MNRKRVLLSLLGLTVACDSGSYYIYMVNAYDSQRDCVSSAEALDIEIGQDPGSSCNAQCIVGADDSLDGSLDGTLVAYATTMCGPTPYGFDTTQSNPLCSSALLALARSDYCLTDGGSTNPFDGSALDGNVLDGSANDGNFGDVSVVDGSAGDGSVMDSGVTDAGVD